ncbi:hypothetical protein F5Y18DRAFT_439599 [Xylariaceae sp. FL1019]|nr:hypothetical protein F5Y18DRAFT_439599 [Xylariaceae sp. FL1019]
MSTSNAAAAQKLLVPSDPDSAEKDEEADQSVIPRALGVAFEQNRRIASEDNTEFITAEHKWCKPTSVPEYLIQYVDQGVIGSEILQIPLIRLGYLSDWLDTELPLGTIVQGISPSGKSNWARTAKIEATDEAGRETNFFIKVLQLEHGKNMVSSEFKTMSKLYSITPKLVAEPIAWGAYLEKPEAYLFICRFCEMSGEIPDLEKFPSMLADMHKRSQSPDGKFGMPYVTYSGRNPQYFPPSESWEECFSKGLALNFDMEEVTHGRDQELQELREGIMAKVIPRLLRPLQTDGRTLTPTLVHGDLWDGNASVDLSTGSPRIFDGVSFYAHNEYDLAPWWAPRHKMTDRYIAEYIKHFPVSEPREDFESRGLLYRLRFDLNSSSLYPGTLRRRGLIKDTMRELLQRFPRGDEGTGVGQT